MTGSEIAEVLDLPLSTVSLWLKRIELGKRSRLEPPEPPNRYEAVALAAGTALATPNERQGRTTDPDPPQRMGLRRVYGSSHERTQALRPYLDRYNYRRRHGSLSHQPPASRLNNLVGSYT